MPTRILIADDSAPVRHALRQAIESTGTWEIIEAENGLDAVAKTREFRPDVVILDLAMPEMDGLTASREITKILPAVPIVMHTLHYSPRVALEALKAGARKVVPKAERSTILAAIEEMLKTEPADQAGSTADAPPAAVIASVVPAAAQPSVPLSEPSAPELPSTTEGGPPPSGETAPKDG